MRIINIHDYPPFQGGGVEINVFKVSEQMAENGHNVTIATSRLSSNVLDSSLTAKKSNVQIVILSSVAQLEEQIDKADIVHIHFTFSCRPAAMQAMRYCVKVGKKCIVSIRTNYEHIPFSSLGELEPLAKESVLNEVKTLWSQPEIMLSAPSNAAASALKSLGIEKQLLVVHNGVSLFDTDVEDDIQPADVTYIGNISNLKGVYDLILATKQMKKVKPDISIRLIGNGKQFTSFKRITDTLGLSPSIEFVGYVDNYRVGSYLQKTHVHAHPSLTEMWPGSVLESLAMGNQLVATNVGGIPEMVDYFDAEADLIEPGDVTSLASNLLARLDCSRSKEQAKKYRERFTIANQTEEFINLYQNLL